jgi:hypothetical protein
MGAEAFGLHNPAYKAGCAVQRPAMPRLAPVDRWCLGIRPFAGAGWFWKGDGVALGNGIDQIRGALEFSVQIELWPCHVAQGSHLGGMASVGYSHTGYTVY